MLVTSRPWDCWRLRDTQADTHGKSPASLDRHSRGECEPRVSLTLLPKRLSRLETTELARTAAPISQSLIAEQTQRLPWECARCTVPANQKLTFEQSSKDGLSCPSSPSLFIRARHLSLTLTLTLKRGVQGTCHCDCHNWVSLATPRKDL